MDFVLTRNAEKNDQGLFAVYHKSIIRGREEWGEWFLKVIMHKKVISTFGKTGIFAFGQCFGEM